MYREKLFPVIPNMKIQFRIFPCVLVDIILSDVVSHKTLLRESREWKRRSWKREKSQLTNETKL
jgi:hypothetical protein